MDFSRALGGFFRNPEYDQVCIRVKSFGNYVDWKKQESNEYCCLLNMRLLGRFPQKLRSYYFIKKI